MTAKYRHGYDHIFVCFGCDQLATSMRANSIACSGACRVRLHRQKDWWASIKANCASQKISPGLMALGAAIIRLCPELSSKLSDGTLEMDSDEVRRAMQGAYYARILDAVENSRVTDSAKRYIEPTKGENHV